MGAFQANILEAMKSLREDFQKSLQKSTQVEVDQTSTSTSKSDPSKTNLHPPSTNVPESMDVDYGPALPPRLDSHDSRVNDASGLPFSAAEEPWRFESDHYSEHSEDSRPGPSRPKKHSDKSKHKSRSRYVPSSSEEDQPSEV